MRMTDTEFDAYCELHLISHAARMFLMRVRNGDPARRVGGGSNNVACRFASKKMRVTIQAESQSPEFAFVTTLEFDDNVLEFYDQCETLRIGKVDKNGRVCSVNYTPDYLVLHKSEGPVLYECKRDEEAHRLVDTDSNWWMDADRNVHNRPLDTWCEAIGLRGRVMLASSIPAQRVQNLQMLADYYDDDAPAVSQEARERIRSQFAQHPWLTRRQLMTSDEQIQGDDINWMVAHQELWVDLDRQVLADDIRALIFRDRIAFDAYQAIEATRPTDDLFKITAVDLQVGNHVLWDGNRYEIANLGETSVYLKTGTSVIQSFTIDDFNKLISSGQLLNASACGNSVSQAADELMMQSSPQDIQAGLERLTKLERGQSGDKGVPRRTLARLKSRFRFGEQVYGSGYLGLITATGKRGNRSRKLHPLVIQDLEKVVAEMILVPDPKSRAACLGELELRCKEVGLAPPSERTFRNYVNSIRKEEVWRAQQGKKASHQFEPWHVSLTYQTPRHGQRPFEIGHIDHTELGLHFVDEKYGKRSMRAWLTVLIDAYSRKILAWYVSFAKPSRVSAMAVIRLCLQKHGRGCDMYVVDQGAEFNGTDFEALLARLTAHKKERPAGKPRFGNIVERFLGVSEQEFIQQLQANNQFLKNPRALSPSHDPTKRAIWTLREFEVAWEKWLNEYYHDREHGTLGVSPNLVFDEGLRRYGQRAHRRHPFTTDLKFLCLPEVRTSKYNTLRVDGDIGCVKVHGVHYHGEILQNRKYHRIRVSTRYDPLDISRVYVFIAGRWHELRCAFAGQLEGFTLHDLHIFTQELNAQHGSTYVRRMDNRQMLALMLRSVQATEDTLKKAKEQEQEPTTHDDPDSSASSAPAEKDSAIELPNKSEKFDAQAHWHAALELIEEDDGKQ
jgi:putative transposase